MALTFFKLSRTVNLKDRSVDMGEQYLASKDRSTGMQAEDRQIIAAG